MTALAHQLLPRRTALELPSAEELDRALRNASPAEVIAAALRSVGRDRLAVVSSFGTESAALLKVMADVDPAIAVVFFDTGWLFEETLVYRDTLIATLGLRDVRSIEPLEETLSREDPDRELWFSDPDACCRIRKVEPLARALAPFSAWINGRKRFQGGFRIAIPVVEDDGVRLKFNPFANVSREKSRRSTRLQNCRRIRSPHRAICRWGACPAPAGPRLMKMHARAAGAAEPKRNAASIRPRRRRGRSPAQQFVVMPAKAGRWSHV